MGSYCTLLPPSLAALPHCCNAGARIHDIMNPGSTPPESDRSSEVLIAGIKRSGIRQQQKVFHETRPTPLYEGEATAGRDDCRVPRLLTNFLSKTPEPHAAVVPAPVAALGESAARQQHITYAEAKLWDNVREDTIRRSWRKLFGIEKASRQETAAPENQPRACPPENEELVNLCNHLPVAEPISAEDISEWINGDEDQALTDDVIIQMLNQPEDDDNDEPDGATEKISHTEGLRTIEGALAYIEQQETATTNDLVWLRRWRNRAASLRSSNLSQKTITDFFGKKD
ncbi:uncharacterized protein LOC124364805 [Homalodisca vitripennis]|uniref:uncharacterized protein LOC124364805 n=1 Tax=Homalodisca vitripennis TaxID=197043 RepID=UPI001EEBC9CA|nr:uncharacterized protein LOC124364805 [Homalodisca vitripennis]